MNQKEKKSSQKLRGGYYTPREITDFLCKWSINSETKNLLEPSCGDGNFIEAAILRYKELGFNDNAIESKIQGVELIKEEAEKASQRVREYGIKSELISNSDFFHFAKNNNCKFDVIVGNPPFIRYQNFPEEHRDIAIKLMNDLGMKPNKLTNIWVPFLVISASLLNENGKLAMVIPAELFQVKYAAETRVFLSNFFDRITIVTFKKLVFKNIQQEVVLLLCEKKVTSKKGIRSIECNNLNDLKLLDFNTINSLSVKSIDHNSEKWIKYFLEENEIELLRKLKNDQRIIPCSDIMITNVGLVTGRNEFFMLNKEQVKKWNLEDSTIPVVSKSNQLKGIKFNEEDFNNNSEELKSIHLFLPPEKDFENLPEASQEYIKYGEENEFHTGYKTRIRKRWYITPSRWIPDAFALRQVGLFPKLILNETGAMSTDTIHRVKFKNDINPKLAIIAFFNSLTFAFSEITGRSYGGGVMTFEPTEIQEIRIPKFDKLDLNFAIIDELIRDKEIEKVLDIVDEALLIKIHGFKKEEVKILRNIWKKLSQRRINRKK